MEARSVSALLERLAHLREGSDHPPLLFVPHLTPAVIRRFAHERVEFVDGAGNVYVDSRAAYALVTGKRPRPVRQGRSLTVSDLEVAFALLAQPRLRLAPYRRLARATGLSLGKISQSIAKLEAALFVRRSRRGGVQLRDAHALLERWEFGFLEQSRVRLSPAWYEFDEGGSTNVDIDRPEALEELASSASKVHGVLVGGVHGARALLADPGAKVLGAQLTLHAPPVRIDALVRKLGLRPTGKRTGLSIIERSFSGNEHPTELELDALPGDNPLRLAHPLLIRAELLAQDSAELRKAARRLLEEHIAPILHPAFHVGSPERLPGLQ